MIESFDNNNSNSNNISNNNNNNNSDSYNEESSNSEELNGTKNEIEENSLNKSKDINQSNEEIIEENYKLENSISSSNVHTMIRDSKEINRTDIRGTETENDSLASSIDHHQQEKEKEKQEQEQEQEKEKEEQEQEKENDNNEKNQVSSTIINNTNEEISSNLSTFDNFSSTASNNNDSLETNKDESTNIEQFSLSGQFKSMREGRLIENFIVVGLSKETVINPGEKISNDAKILYSYPPDKPCDPQVVNFCFPDGVKLIQIKRRNSLTEFNSVLYKSLSQLEGSDSSFMFLITGGEHLMYGCCVLNTELINEFPYFFPESIELNKKNNSGSDESSTTSTSPFCYFSPRCYCVISRYPFFKAHFDFIYSILGKERLNKVNRSIHEQEKLEKTLQKQQNEQRKQPIAIQQRQSLAIQPSSYLSYNFQEGKSQLSVSQQPQQQQFRDYFFSSDSPKQLSASSNEFSKYINNMKSRPNKPLPPLPQNNLSKSSFPTPFSPIAVSPADSPVLNSSTEETSLLQPFSSPSNKLGHHRAASTSIVHTRSHSTPISQSISKLAQQQHLQQQQQQQQFSISSNNNNGINGSTNLDESLSAIQESLSNDTFESESDLSSSTNSFQIYNSFNNSSTQFYNSNNSSKFSSPAITNQNNNHNNKNNNGKDGSSSESNSEGSSGQTSPKPLPKLPTIAVDNSSISGSKLLPPPPSGPQLTVEQYLSSSTNSNPSSKTPSPTNQSQLITTTTTSETVTSTTTTTNQTTTSTTTNTTTTTTTITSPPPLPPKRKKGIKEIEEEDEENLSSKFPNLIDEVIQTIEIFYNTNVPLENQKLTIHYPNEQPAVYGEGDDSYQIEKWCLSGLIKTLSLKTIMEIISCVLLEKFILVTSKNIGTISNTIFGLLPLLRPFEYQGAFIPILPNTALDALHCPIPFIIGITKLPNSSEMKDALDNCYILDVDNDQIKLGTNCSPILPLPEQNKLETFTRPFYREVSKEDRKKYYLDYPFKSIPSEFKCIQSFSNEFKLFNRFILDSIGFYIDWNPNFDFGNSIHKEQLLRLIHQNNYNFIDQFLHSQLFTTHIELLFERGGDKINNTNINNNNNNNNTIITLNTYKTSRL
ncbi:hypothetical protein DICPUDRAFT_96860 [Dictyostelium purpureum]|uniref:UDENN domain-containing protein n=1 Tax=Dictyostelium purpureum TaxID=5786 RepID=F0ZBT9_DICPU|nr:uncharacterized protein DICPUDRAFT_96860 [Dictyostelium purpureum]EGC38597.1 hypothetical protein DICPUDRAFT_96860 [Dictyostelium purpureum]|eukprot:XP_003284876.1 hypothetical protein DICPUDRAFT_96860 [Dictyostelium purpureum]